MKEENSMYRKVLKDVVSDLERTNDLLEVKKYLNTECDRNDFLNIINELLNQLSEEKAEVQDMNCKIKKLKSELNRKCKIVNNINSFLNEDIEII